jgi:hypothetical protein
MAFKIRFQREAATVKKGALLVSLEGVEGRKYPFFYSLSALDPVDSAMLSLCLREIKVKFHAFLTLALMDVSF